MWPDYPIKKEVHCGRYAPSPSGDLHIGNARSALIAWLYSRLKGGRFILRIEDIDEARCKPCFTESIVDDLKWMGIDWDQGPVVSQHCADYLQSQRLSHYQQAFDYLYKKGLIYPCYCSRKQLQAMTDEENQAGYPGYCRARQTDPNNADVIDGLLPAWRLNSDRLAQLHPDVVKAQWFLSAKQAGDFIIKRRDGVFAYQLAVVVDDILMGVTDIVRGADLLDSTPWQNCLYYAFERPIPRYIHLPLMTDNQGLKYSKRDGSQGLSAKRKSPVAHFINELLATLGLSDKRIGYNGAVFNHITIEDIEKMTINDTISKATHE